VAFFLSFLTFFYFLGYIIIRLAVRFSPAQIFFYPTSCSPLHFDCVTRHRVPPFPMRFSRRLRVSPFCWLKLTPCRCSVSFLVVEFFFFPTAFFFPVEIFFFRHDPFPWTDLVCAVLSPSEVPSTGDLRSDLVDPPVAFLPVFFFHRHFSFLKSFNPRHDNRLSTLVLNFARDLCFFYPPLDPFGPLSVFFLIGNMTLPPPVRFRREVTM